MQLRLREELFHCFSGTHAIFLDSETNRYFELTPMLAGVFRKIVEGKGLAEGDKELADDLLTGGILVRSSLAGAQWPDPIPPPTGDYPHVETSQPSTFLILKALYARIWARQLVDGNGIKGLRRAVEKLPKSKRSYSSSPFLRLAKLGAAFRAADRLVSARDQCLPRSIAFHRLAIASGCHTQILLGVRTNPFAAHCWVELDHKVVTDDFEQARLFSPILRLG